MTTASGGLRPPLADVSHQQMLFQHLRGRLLWNTIQVVLQKSLLRVVSILACSLLVWGSLFVISYLGFKELKVRWDFPLNGRIMGLTFDLLFVSLSVLLIFSTGIILYSSLFASAETAFLLSSPLSPDHIYAYKFQGAIGFSSWAFVLLGSPILLAYGLQVGDGAPWYFYVVLPLFFLGFVLLPGSFGALLCFFLVAFLPRHRKQVLVLAIGLVIVLPIIWIYQVLPASQDLLTSRDWVRDLLNEISLLQGPLIPAHWIAEGLQSAALGEVGSMAYNLALVWSNGLFIYVVAAWIAGRYYRRAFNRVATGGTLRRRYGGAWIDALVTRTLCLLDPQTRLLIIKDFRTFRRDPAQWAQILIFLALAVLYFSNIRRFYEQEIGRAFQNGISLLNLVAISFLMCAYTGRFIFPMLSLEGRKFWILGLLPFERERLLWGKFAFSASGCLVVGEFLVVFSNYMLNMPGHIIAVHAVTMIVLALALSGMSVGLGACLPNFRESDPSKIAVGFGGTLNLVAGLLLLIVVVALMAGPWHLALAAGKETGLEPVLENWWPVIAGLFLLGIAAGIMAVLVPLRAGARALRRMEF
jgi:ABC-2 type transport system permease protein